RASAFSHSCDCRYPKPERTPLFALRVTGCLRQSRRLQRVAKENIDHFAGSIGAEFKRGVTPKIIKSCIFILQTTTGRGNTLRVTSQTPVHVTCHTTAHVTDP